MPATLLAPPAPARPASATPPGETPRPRRTPRCTWPHGCGRPAAGESSYCRVHRLPAAVTPASLT